MRKLIFLWSLIGLISSIRLIAGDDVINSTGPFKLLMVHNGQRTKIYVLYNSESNPVWEATETATVGGNNLDHWCLLDAAYKEDQIALLLGTESDDLFWVKVTRQINGTWKVDFAERLHGVASDELGTQQMKLKGVDAVVIVNRNISTTYTMNNSGALLKNGVVYDEGLFKIQIK